MPGVLKQINRSNGGLPKVAVPEPAMLRTEGVEDDWHRDPVHHGGPDKAVLMIAAEFIDEMAAAGFPVYYGALGENLTVSGFDPHTWRAGQRYRVGPEALIELTTLRVPCSQVLVYGQGVPLAMYDAQCNAGDFTSPHWAHGGFYARVIRGGLIFAGAPVILESDVA